MWLGVHEPASCLVKVIEGASPLDRGMSVNTSCVKALLARTIHVQRCRSVPEDVEVDVERGRVGSILLVAMPEGR